MARNGIAQVLRWCVALAMATSSLVLAAPAANAAPTTVGSANGCYATAIHGGLGLGLNRQINRGGPNFTSGVCRDINIKLTTNAAFRTWARACLEPRRGGLDCGSWVLLEFNKWQVLRRNVAGGTRWQIQMAAASPETVNFDYTA